MDRVLAVIRKKHPFYLYSAIVYLLVMTVIKWWLAWDLASILFLAGGIIGIYFLDIAEAFFRLSPSPFRSVLFAGGVIIVTLFVVTSSNSRLAQGLVLSIYLTLVLWMVGQWRLTKNTDSWYQMIAGGASAASQKLILYMFSGIFVLLSLLYVTL